VALGWVQVRERPVGKIGSWVEEVVVGGEALEAVLVARRSGSFDEGLGKIELVVEPELVVRSLEGRLELVLEPELQLELLEAVLELAHMAVLLGHLELEPARLLEEEPVLAVRMFDFQQGLVVGWAVLELAELELVARIG